jgi:hypothetical protein
MGTAKAEFLHMTEENQGGAEPASGYRHTQVGLISILALLSTVPLFWVGPTETLAGTAIVAYSVVAAVLVAVTGALTVSVDRASIRWSLGIGILQGRVPLAAVQAVELVPVRFPKRGAHDGFWYGASVDSIVRLSLADQTHELIRSSEPVRLANAIERELERAKIHQGTSKDGGGSLPTRRAKSYRILSSRLLFLVLVALIPAMAHEGLSPWTRPKPGSLFVGTRWHRTVLYRQRVQHVELIESIPRTIRKLERYSLGWNPAGRYLLEGLGDTRLFLASESAPYVLVRGPDGTVIFNAPEPERTERYFERLGGWLKGPRDGL